MSTTDNESSMQQAAQIVGVPVEDIARAKILNQNAPDLAERVMAGSLSLSTAYTRMMTRITEKNNMKQTTAVERHYDGLKPDAVVDLIGDMPVNDPAVSTHKHVIVQWEGGEIWLDMSIQKSHFCVDVRQFNFDDEMKGQGVFTIVNGRRMSLGTAVERTDDGFTTTKMEPLPDTDGVPVTGNGWNGGYVITLMADRHGQEAAAKLPSQGNG